MSRDGTRVRGTGTREHGKNSSLLGRYFGMETGIELLTSSSYSFKLPVTGQLTS